MKRRLSIILLCFILALGLLPLNAQASGAPYTLPEGPTNLTAELKKDDEGIPYFELRVNIPQSVTDLAKKLDMDNDNALFPGYDTDYMLIQFDFKYGDYDWNEGPTHFWDTSRYVTNFVGEGCIFDYHLYDSSTKPEDIDIKSETYQFRARFEAMWGYEGEWVDKYIYSPYSAVVTISNPAYWNNSSEWAEPELQKAADAGLIPDILKGADMTKPITREEFAELSVLLCEKVTGQASEAVFPNPFKDTTNPQILKAFNWQVS